MIADPKGTMTGMLHDSKRHPFNTEAEMADPKNQHQKPDGSGNPKEEKTDSGTGALDAAVRSTKDRATGADEPAPKGQGLQNSAASKRKPKRGEMVTTSSVHHDGKTYPPNTPVKSMGLDSDQHADLKARGHVGPYTPDDVASEDDGDQDDE